MRIEKEKMQRQFEAVPYLIFVYVGQLICIFFMNMVFMNLDEWMISYEEKVMTWFLLGVFYILYFNGIIKFIKSFYEIMKTSKIDDSDLVAIDAWITFGLGVIFLLFGLSYILYSPIKSKRFFGGTSIAVTMFLWTQSFLLRKFYVVAAENQISKND